MNQQIEKINSAAESAVREPEELSGEQRPEVSGSEEPADTAGKSAVAAE